uniref:RING-type domain-containing protein n=1 Tax=Astyanax mexicanus TaxID=7994 RepID=A0A8B9HNG4_ASTMX
MAGNSGLSCGHKIDPQILKQDCYRQMNEEASELTCPICKTELSYPEVRNYVKLTSEEKRFFERKLDDNSHAKTACPGCHFFIEKADKNNMCVKCTVCSERTGRNYEFCFQCLREWRGPRPRSDRCDNPGCPKLLEVLNCRIITLTNVQGAQCPELRACPSCGSVNGHNGKACKHINCTSCQRQFCFICVKPCPSGCSSGPYVICPTGVAPKEESIKYMK